MYSMQWNVIEIILLVSLPTNADSLTGFVSKIDLRALLISIFLGISIFKFSPSADLVQKSSRRRRPFGPSWPGRLVYATKLVVWSGFVGLDRWGVFWTHSTRSRPSIF